MKGGKDTGSSQMHPGDVELLEAFASMQGLDTASLVRLAMASLASQLRVQVPHCARCPLMAAHTAPPAANVIPGPWPGS